MGWLGGHLHEFDIDGLRYGITDPEWDTDPDLISQNRKRLDRLLAGNTRFSYLYDFGDHWLHEIRVKRILTAKAPPSRGLCVEGEGACPPEDVGGLPGFYEFLRVMVDPDDPEHDDMAEWYGGEYDPEHLDIDQTNDQLRRIKL